LLPKKKLILPENYPKLVYAKQVTFKSISQDLVLQNYFESLSSNEQEAQE